MVQQALDDDAFNRRYREAGYRAILEWDTYAHRAGKILNFLGFDYLSQSSMTG